MTIIIKKISPNKLKTEAMLNVIKKELERTANDMLLDFELTTATWDHKVKFVKQTNIDMNNAQSEILIGTDDEIWRYVDEGTRPHEIRPKIPGGSLAFPSMYKAKTTPGIIPSHHGGSSGSTVFAKSVHHPGTKPRKFTKTIQERWRIQFYRRLYDAMPEAAKASGHAV